MTYTKINLYLANGIPEALSNLWYGSDSSVVEIRDAVEDAKNGKAVSTYDGAEIFEEISEKGA